MELVSGSGHSLTVAELMESEAFQMTTPLTKQDKRTPQPRVPVKQLNDWTRPQTSSHEPLRASARQANASGNERHSSPEHLQAPPQMAETALQRALTSMPGSWKM
mmetsp:Transcript_61304/g.165422  ORF Transcript_61304/g.165422 Transcript_61304/m.165422 type:complete len:105 (+) Transcript_61304:647-961(+)